MRYNRLIRWVLLRFSDYLWEDRILDYLYPDDAMITFGPGEAEVSG